MIALASLRLCHKHCEVLTLELCEHIGIAVESAHIYKIFGSRVAAARSDAGLTQDALASSLGLSRASIANIEAGRQRILLHQAIDFADALGLTDASELFPVDLLSLRETDGEAAQVQFSGSTLSSSEAGNLAQIIANA